MRENNWAGHVKSYYELKYLTYFSTLDEILISFFFLTFWKSLKNKVHSLTKSHQIEQ